MTFATDRLNDLVSGKATLPRVTTCLKMGGLDSWEPGMVRKTYQLHDDFKHPDGTLYGGYLSALADQMATFAAMTVIPDGHLWRTQNLEIDFFRLIRGETLTAVGRVRNHGTTLIHTVIEFIREDNKCAAEARGTLFLTPA